MRQFLVAEARPGAVLEIGGADYHYLVRVLRLGPGAVIPVADAAGRHAQATVTAVAGGRVRLAVGAADDASTAPAAAAAAEPGPRWPPGAIAVTLVQALPKGALMDRIVRQATELGVARIVPVIAERTQGRAGPEANARRHQRWQRIARQAAQQSGSDPPPIDPPLPLRRYLEQAPRQDLGLLFQYGGAPLRAGMPLDAPAGPVHRRTHVDAAHRDTAAAPRRRRSAACPGAGPGARANRPPAVAPGACADAHRAPSAPRAGRSACAQAGLEPGAHGEAPEIRCAVGPEGGFSVAETALLRDHGFHPAGLPGGVLRVDTAAVAAVTAARQCLASFPDR